MTSQSETSQAHRELADAIEVLKAREERRLNKIMWWSGSLALICVVILAVLLLRK